MRPVFVKFGPLIAEVRHLPITNYFNVIVTGKGESFSTPIQAPTAPEAAHFVLEELYDASLDPESFIDRMIGVFRDAGATGGHLAHGVKKLTQSVELARKMKKPLEEAKRSIDTMQSRIIGRPPGYVSRG